MSAASTALGRPTFGVSSQITPPPTRSVSESTQPVDQVAVVVAPPQQDGVDHVAVVAVDHVGVDGVLDRDPELVVGVVVPAELLDDHAGRRSPAVPPARSVVDPSGLRGIAARGRAHCSSTHLQASRHAGRRTLRCGSSPAELAAGAQPAATRVRLAAVARATAWVDFAGCSRACNDGRVSDDTTTTSEAPATSQPLGALRDPRGAAHAAPRHRPRRDQPTGSSPSTACVDERGRERARYVMLRLLERAREKQVGVPALRSTDYINTIPPEREPWFPGDEDDRAPDPRVHPLERRGHGVQRQPQGPRGRRPHRDVPVLGQPLRGRLQPLLPRQGPPRRRRPDLHPGPRLPRHLRPRLPRGPADRGAALPVPPGGPARPGQRPVVVPAPPADAGLLGVPDGVDGPDRPQLDLPGAVQPLPAQPRHQGHLRPAGVGVPRRRRDGRARVARRDRPRRPRGARQPHLRRQLQPAAARRPGPRQRQDHPGAGVVLPRRRLERHQGRLGPRVGRAARPRRRRRPRQPDEHHARRPVPDLLDRGRRLHPRPLLRQRPAAAQDGRAHDRRRRSRSCRAAATTTARCTPRSTPPPSTPASRR